MSCREQSCCLSYIFTLGCARGSRNTEICGGLVENGFFLAALLFVLQRLGQTVVLSVHGHEPLVAPLEHCAVM